MKNKKSISYRIYSKKNLKMAEEKTTLLGVNNKLDAVDLLNIRLFISVVVFISILYFIDFGYFIAPLVSFLVYQLFFPIVVDTKIEKRRKILEKDSLYFFEILLDMNLLVFHDKFVCRNLLLLMINLHLRRSII